jgi:hypothetical protein
MSFSVVLLQLQEFIMIVAFENHFVSWAVMLLKLIQPMLVELFYPTGIKQCKFDHKDDKK